MEPPKLQHDKFYFVLRDGICLSLILISLNQSVQNSHINKNSVKLDSVKPCLGRYKQYLLLFPLISHCLHLDLLFGLILFEKEFVIHLACSWGQIFLFFIFFFKILAVSVFVTILSTKKFLSASILYLIMIVSTTAAL